MKNNEKQKNTYTTNNIMKILEISFGMFDESDIKRLEDDCARRH